MSGEKARTVALWLAGTFSVGMGSFHFWLPTLFGWQLAMANAPDSLQWALQSLNFFWSLLTVLAGVGVVVLAHRGAWKDGVGRIVLLLLAAYWAGHAAYLLLRPFPLPAGLTWLGRCFVAFALAQMIMHAWPALTAKPRVAVRAN